MGRGGITVSDGLGWCGGGVGLVGGWVWSGSRLLVRVPGWFSRGGESAGLRGGAGQLGRDLAWIGAQKGQPWSLNDWGLEWLRGFLGR